MKSYIIKIEIAGSEPIIWRRVIMPAGATFNRLNDIIQNVTNFQSGYPYGDYHLCEFDLRDENLIVTNDEEAFQSHQHYKKNKKMYDERLKTMPTNMVEFEKQHQEQLKVEVKKPTRIKIDDYLEKYKEIKYIYDFGDNWIFTIILEDIVDDYYFGFATLLDGAETAPPEDVGGLDGFYEFLEAYRDSKHPDHQEIKAWADAQYFKEYDPEWIKSYISCSGMQYKKNEWDKINHENYRVIEDKYRK